MTSLRKQQAITIAVCAAILISRVFTDLNDLHATAIEHLKVFGSFWASGWAVAHHANPYAAYPLTWRFHPYLHRPFTMVDLNLSPPALLPFFHLLSFFRPDSAIKVWTFSSLALLFGCAILMMVQPHARVQKRQLLWLFLCPAAFDTLSLGQDYIFLMALALLAWLSLTKKRELTAGILIGILVAAKPNYALWPLFLFFCGQRQAAKTAILSALSLSILPVLFYGPSVYIDWMHAIARNQHWIFPMDVSITGFAARLNHRTIGQIVSFALLIASCFFVGLRRPSIFAATGIALCIGTIAAPLAWFHYSLLLAPLLLSIPWNKKLTWTIAPLMLPVVIPMTAMSRSPLAMAIAGAFYLLPFLLLTAYFIRSDHNHLDGVLSSSPAFMSSRV